MQAHIGEQLACDVVAILRRFAINQFMLFDCDI